MSPNSNSRPDINQLPNEGTRARANTTVSSMTASSTMGSLGSIEPSTPNLQRDGHVVDYTPAGQDDIATPPTQPLSRLSISGRRNFDLVDQGGNDQSKVPHQLAAPGQIESSGNQPTRPSAAIDELLHHSDQVKPDEQTEGVQQSPNSDPFEYDDNVFIQSSVPTRESVDHSDPLEEHDDTNDVQYSTFSDQSESGSSLSTDITTADVEENEDSNVVEQLPTSDQSDSTGSLLIDPTTVEPTPTLTPPAEIALDQFDALVGALPELSPPFTFDGDIVMPDGQDLKLHVCEKGYNASLKPQPPASRNKYAKSAKVQTIDKSKEWSHDFQPEDHGSTRQLPLIWSSIVKIKAIDLAIGESSHGKKAFREMSFDQFALKPDILAESDIVSVIKQQLGELGNLTLDITHATLRVCIVGVWHGTDVSANSSHGKRIGTIVLGLPVMSEKGDLVVRKTIKSDASCEETQRNEKVIFDWAKQWMSQDPADVRPRWMFFPSGTRYAIEDTCLNEHRGHAKDDVHFVIEYPVYVAKDAKRSESSNPTESLSLALRSIMDTADRDLTISFVLSRSAAKLGDGCLDQVETELGQPHSIQPDAILYKAIKDLDLVPTFEHVNDEPINPVSDTYPRVESTSEATFPVRVRDEAKRVISLTYNDSKPAVLIGAPILDDAENVGGRVVMTVEIPKPKGLVGQQEDVAKQVQTGLHAKCVM